MAGSSGAAVGLPWVIAAVAVAFAIGVQWSSTGLHLEAANVLKSFNKLDLDSVKLPETAQLIRPADNAVLETVLPPLQSNASTVRARPPLFFSSPRLSITLLGIN